MGFITPAQFKKGLEGAKGYVDEKMGDVAGIELGQRITAVEGLLDGRSVGVNVPVGGVLWLLS